MGKILITSVLSLLVTLSMQAMSVEIIHYDNKPVTIELIEGQERTIQFSDHVQVGISQGQKVKKLFRVQSAQGAVHFLAYKVFDKQRIQIKRIGDNRVVLIDLIARKANKKAKPLESIEVLLDVDNVIGDKQKQMANQEKPFSRMPVVTPVDLTRFAAQKLYGPTRLHKTPRGISETEIAVKDTIKLFKGENKYKTVSRALLAYQGGAHYLTAIHIQNVDANPVQLNYLDLNLPFSHATFQHHRLGGTGTAGDSTILYLVSDKTMKETLYPWTYYRDAVAEAKEAETKRKREAHKKSKHVDNKAKRR